MEDYKDDLDSVISSAKNKGVTHIITVGIDLQSSLNAISIAKKYKNLYASVGIHPHNASRINDQDYKALATMTCDKSNKIVAYGEIGLDYVKKYSPPEKQKYQFQAQLAMAKDLHLPVIIHDRGAHSDTIKLLKNIAPFPAGGVMHCFSGDMNLALQVLELGFYISIPGIVTFTNAKELHEVAHEIPLDRLVLETDGPFLAPVPFRGKRNLPEYLGITAARIAELRNISVDEVGDTTSRNAKQLFRLQ